MSIGTFMTQNGSATGLYLDVLRSLLTGGQQVSPRGMETCEYRGAQVVLTDPLRCIVDIPPRKLNYHFMVAEWWWIAMGDNRVESIKHYCNEIEKFSDDGLVFYGAYGPRWRRQIDAVVRNLKSDKDSRQAVVTIFRPEFYDAEMNYVVKTTKDVPCTVSMQYMIRDERLETVVTMRSWDAYLGFPYDIFNFSRLAAMVAGELGIELGPLMVQAGSLHLYERNYEKAEELLSVTWSKDLTALEPLPGILDTGSMRLWEAHARRSGFVDDEIPQPWVSYLRVLADRKEPRFDLPEPFKFLIPSRLPL